jgi:hypothetical protein
MSKIAIGCAGFLAAGVVGAAGASYYAYHKVTSAVAPLYELGSAGGFEGSVREQGRYDPPASGEPSPAQVERLLEVQRAIRARLGSRGDEFYHRYRRYFEPVNGVTAPVGGAVDSAALGLRMSLDLVGIYVEGKRAQVDALNRAGLSLEEYRWTRSRTYAALGVPLLDLDVAGMIADLKAGRQPATPPPPRTEAPASSPAGRRIVEPYRKVLEENVGLAFFDL